MTKDRLIVFSDDWGRHPSSCQYLVGELLPRVDVLWVNTIGMRPPRVDLITVKRGAEKILGWFGHEKNPSRLASHSRKPMPSRLRVIDARMWPWMTHTWDRKLNAWLLCRQLAKEATGRIGLTTIPIVAGLIGRLPVERWVYYCVDDFAVWPGLDGKTLSGMEDVLVEKIGAIIVASESLRKGVLARGRESNVLTHGVDITFWNQPAASLPKELEKLPRPWVVFWGVVDRRMNADWVLAVATELREGTVILAGPQQDPDFRLAQHSRIVMTGALPIDQLPALATNASVLIMPYSDMPVTRAMQPLKLKEYLATGKPVVCAPLPAVLEWADTLDIANSAEEFVRIVQYRINVGGEALQIAARTRLESESWTAKSLQFAKMIGLEQF